jgi:cephalosporin-C deacetylase-like acetyl esterase
MDPYSYQGSEPNFNLRWKEITKKWSSRLVDFPSAFHDSHWGSNIVRGEYFRPWHRGSVPLAILLHGMGDHSVIPCRLLAKSLASNGVACLILYLVVHSSRMPLVMKRQFPHLTSEEWFQVYQTSVIEVRQAIDWASSRQEIDRGKLAVVGISFGGFISAIAMGIDQRIGAGVFIVSGGNNEKIGYMSGLSTITKEYRRTEAEYQRLQRYYFQYLAEVAKKGLENVDPPRRSFLTDPMTYAHRLRQRPVLMINSRWDEAISAEATLDFWQECGRPDIVWLPATHATIWLWYPLIRRKIDGFLKASFGKREGYRQYLSGGGER